MGNCCCGRFFVGPSPTQRRSHAWAATGIVGLRDEHLKELPTTLRNIAGKITVMDISINQIRALPNYLEEFSQLQRLTITKNELVTLPDEIANLAHLKVLILDMNKISTFPKALCELNQLEKLSMKSNCLTSLPSEMGRLESLKEINVSLNRIALIEIDFNSLTSLEMMNLSNNMLTDLPLSLRFCSRLKELFCEKNRLQTIPSEILIQCSSLQTLTLDENFLNIKDLEETEGYKALETRRRSKANKAISANVMMGEGTLNESIIRKT